MAGWDFSKFPQANGRNACAAAAGHSAKPAASALTPGEDSQEGALARLSRQLREAVEDGDMLLQEREREDVKQRILGIMSDVAAALGIEGDICAFGSFASGFQRGGSDLDLSLLTHGELRASAADLLNQFVPSLSSHFQNLTKVFLATTPLLKFTDEASGLEIDFCINNRLGVRNTRLLQCYSRFDPRVRCLGWLLKDWTRAHAVVGTGDGHLNSYAYMLLLIHFLQQCSPPVVPNLQDLATEPAPMVDKKWGYDDKWDCKFVEEVERLPPSQNRMELGELLAGFFNYYGHHFDWERHAVCVRLNREKVAIDKFSLPTPTSKEQWYVEDPFDLRHNLASKCTAAARQRLLKCLRESYSILNVGSDWRQACPEQRMDGFLLRCRISRNVTAQMLQREFKDCGIKCVWFPNMDRLKYLGPIGQAFLEFPTAAMRRLAQTKNETTIADCPLSMLDSTCEALDDALSSGDFTLVEGSVEVQGPCLRRMREESQAC